MSSEPAINPSLSRGDGNNIVDVCGIAKTYGGGVQALKGVDLAIPSGKMTTLLGPSGCGKTTVLRAVAVFERPSSGRVLINQQLVSNGKRHLPPEQRQIGMVFQDFALLPWASSPTAAKASTAPTGSSCAATLRRPSAIASIRASSSIRRSSIAAA